MAVFSVYHMNIFSPPQVFQYVDGRLHCPFARILAPHTKKKNGTGISTALKHPNTVVPQSTPILLYMGKTNSGKAPADRDLRKLFAAIALEL